MQVTNRFQALQYLKKLPEDFNAVKVDLKSLKDNSLRKLCRDLEKQLDVEQGNLNYDRESYEDYLKKLLDDERFDTKDIEISLIVLGNRQGFLSGRIFNQADFQKQVIDVNQFDDNYPIFIDTSTIKFLETGKTSEQVKREREETFSHDPEPKQSRIETIPDLQAAWAEQEDEYRQEIESTKKKYEAEQENNRMILKSAAENEQYFTATVNSLKEKIHQLEVSRIQESVANDEISQLREMNEQLKNRIDEIAEQKQEDSGKVMGLFGGSPSNQGDIEMTVMNETQSALEDQLTRTKDVIEKQLSTRTTLSQYGITTWNPKTTSFLDYLITFRVSVLAVEGIKVDKAIQLLFSSLPSEYAHLRSIVSSHPDFKKHSDSKSQDYSNHYLDVERILVRIIVGGQEKIFSEFMKLQKKPNYDFLRYFQKVCDFYLFACEDITEYKINGSISVLDKDAMAFKMIKEKMCAALPNRYVPEFKRRIEGKTKMGEMYLALLDLRDQFPDIEENEVYSGTNLHVLKQKKADWKKKVKCFRCGRTGHIKRECYARESKTKKTGIPKDRK